MSAGHEESREEPPMTHAELVDVSGLVEPVAVGPGDPAAARPVDGGATRPVDGAAPAASGGIGSAPGREDASLLALVDRLTAVLERGDLGELEVATGGTTIILRASSAIERPAAIATAAAVAEAPVAPPGGGGQAPTPAPRPAPPRPPGHRSRRRSPGSSTAPRPRAPRPTSRPATTCPWARSSG